MLELEVKNYTRTVVRIEHYTYTVLVSCTVVQITVRYKISNQWENTYIAYTRMHATMILMDAVFNGNSNMLISFPAHSVCSGSKSIRNLKSKR